MPADCDGFTPKGIMDICFRNVDRDSWAAYALDHSASHTSLAINDVRPVEYQVRMQLHYTYNEGNNWAMSHYLAPNSESAKVIRERTTPMNASFFIVASTCIRFHTVALGRPDWFKDYETYYQIYWRSDSGSLGVQIGGELDSGNKYDIEAYTAPWSNSTLIFSDTDCDLCRLETVSPI